MTGGQCPYCYLTHAGRCPFVQAIEYHPDGTVRRVEFVKPEPLPIDWSKVMVGPSGLVADGKGGLRVQRSIDDRGDAQ